MTCNRFERWIALYLEGDLSERTSRRVEAHLRTCSICRQFAQELRQSQAALKTLGNELLDDQVFQDLQERVLDQIALREFSARETRVPWFHWSWRWERVVIAALLLLVGASAVWRGQLTKRHGKGAVVVQSTESRLGGLVARKERTEKTNDPLKHEEETAEVASNHRASSPNASHLTRPSATLSSGRRRGNSQTLRSGFHHSLAKEIEERRSQTKPISGVGNERPVESPDGNGEAAKPEPLVIKLLTSDPDIVIVWLVDQNGGVRE